MSSGLAPIPWRYVDSAGVLLWIWHTPHFEVTITAETNSFVWVLGDMVASVDGAAQFLAEGRVGSFDDAERAVREHVGKCYPPHLGYEQFCGALATTFVIATGESVDLGAFEAKRSLVTVRLPNGINATYTGSGHVSHFEFELEMDSKVLKIQPSHIVKIVKEGGGGAVRNSAYTGVGRVYRGDIGPSCNGKPGFFPGTVDHNAPAPCPVHEELRWGRPGH